MSKDRWFTVQQLDHSTFCEKIILPGLEQEFINLMALV